MKSVKGHQEEEEVDEDFGSKKDTTPSNNNTKDGKNSDKINAMRSKHSVTEQRRRSKINERFQILRDLIPYGDQKRDTASFLLEVIQYVKVLQEKVQKYEGSYQPWGLEPTKLMPWRNSHWRVQSFVSQPQTATSGSGPVSTLVPTAMQPGQQNPIESDPIRDPSCRSMDPQTELPNRTIGVPSSTVNGCAFSQSLSRAASDAQSTEYHTVGDSMNRQDELTIEGGTIIISSVYSQGLLNSLTKALQSTGVDLSQASISIQINLGKRANRGLSIAKDHDVAIPRGGQSVSEDFDQTQKRLKI
ncbi:hypothetical protein CDL12_30188 [Handroanthus impetiginosus]|uniref:BHLH domain-containing protein n=1 Tax=Handroanthus impetiginosus TaxID=429701 RepID=A0A2G9FWB2_9LAMI|nr:hypothetical protein CDL12_30188 [Handroanthus impetiginosus]